MRYKLLESQRNELLLAARILLMILFVIFGWGKLTHFHGTVGYMAAEGAPFELQAINTPATATAAARLASLNL